MSRQTSQHSEIAEKTEHGFEKMNASQESNRLLNSRTKLFLFCFCGIFVFFILFGILQEKITKKEYGSEKEKFQFSMTLVLVQCIANSIFAKLATKVWKTPSDLTPTYYYMAMATAYVGAMICSSDALRFVSYPTQALGKSIKPIPIMVLGVLLAKKRYTLKKYLFVLLIVMGVALFMYKPQQSPGKAFTLGYGELLLCFSLFLDGFTGGIQDRIRNRYPVNAYSMMLNNNIWAVIYLTIGTVLTGEMLGFIAFAQKYPSVLLQLLLLAMFGAVGQNFIYITVTTLGPLTCSIITTTRKFFTILCSVFLFGHSLTSIQWFGTLMVFTGLSLDVAFGKNPPKITKS